MFRRPTMFASLVLAFFVMAGLQAVWSTTLALGYKTISSALAAYPGQLLVDPGGLIVFEQDRNGEPHFLKPDGRPADVPEFNYWLDGSSLLAPSSARERRRHLSWAERLSETTVTTRPPVTWYLMHSPISDGEAYFIGYNYMNKRVVGYLDRTGFRAAAPPRELWFSVTGAPGRQLLGQAFGRMRTASGSTKFSASTDPEGVVYLAARDGVWRIDLAARAVKMFYVSQDAVSLSASPVVKEAPADEVPKGWRGPFYVLSGADLLMRTPSKVIALDPDGKQRTSWPIPPPLRSANFEWYELAEGGALAAELRTDGDVYWKDFQSIDREGNITREEKVSMEPSPPASKKYWEMAAIAPQVVLMSLIEAVMLPTFAVENGLQPDYPAALAQTFADGWAALLAVYLFSVTLATLAYRRQARFALPGAGVWAAFVFLFGLPGWLAYRWHRRWPVLEACGECRRPAPRDRESCASCGQVFAPPPLVGTEVFA